MIEKDSEAWIQAWHELDEIERRAGLDPIPLDDPDRGLPTVELGRGSIRDGLLFSGGLFGFLYEIFVVDVTRPAMLTLFLLLMMLPAALIAGDSERPGTTGGGPR